MKLRLTLLLALWLTGSPGHCDEKMRRLQEELRKRNLYFGEIDGQLSDELQKALARYQQVKGFTVSGTVDADTAVSLGMSQPDPAAAITMAMPPPLPDEPVLKSDAARELTEEEQKIVEQIQTVDLPPPMDGPWLRITESTPPISSVSAPTVDSMGADVETFLRDYLVACENNDIDAEMAYYAPSVEYFDHGARQHDFIRRDVLAYYKRWPKRHYELAEMKITPGAHEEQKVVRFRLRFRVSNGSSTASGQTENRFVLRRDGQAMKFISLKEQRLRDAG